MSKQTTGKTVPLTLCKMSRGGVNLDANLDVELPRPGGSGGKSNHQLQPEARTVTIEVVRYFIDGQCFETREEADLHAALLKGDRMKCPRCEGKGKVEVQDCSDLSRNCFLCNGKGYLVKRTVFIQDGIASGAKMNIPFITADKSEEASDE